MHQHRPKFWLFQLYLFKRPWWDSNESSQSGWEYLLHCNECDLSLTLTEKERKRYFVSLWCCYLILFSCYYILFFSISPLRDLTIGSNLFRSIFVYLIPIVLAYLISYFWFKRIHFEEISPPEEVAELKEA